VKNSEVLAFGFILMQGEMKTFQNVLKVRQPERETDRQTDRQMHHWG